MSKKKLANQNDLDTETKLKTQSNNQSNTLGPNQTVINNIMTFICCLLIALGLNDAVFNGMWRESIFTTMSGILLMPGIMNWNFVKANKYQKFALISIVIFNIVVIGYLILRSFRII